LLLPDEICPHTQSLSPNGAIIHKGRLNQRQNKIISHLGLLMSRLEFVANKCFEN